MHVLFIGNSYVYFNNLPGLLRSLAAEAGVAMEVASVVEGGMTLLGHLRHGQAVERIRTGSWDVVILQEQSERPIRSPTLMRAVARQLQCEIVHAGAKTVLFLTWARQGQSEQQQSLDASYGAIAQALGAAVAPVGPAWQRAQAERRALALYQADGSHPASAGTYLAACVFLAVLTERCPIGLTTRTVHATDGGPSLPVQLAEADAAFLQHVAWETVRKSGPVLSPDQPKAMEPVDADDLNVEIELLRETPLLHGLTASQVRTCLTTLSKWHIADRTPLCVAGDHGGAAFIVLNGTFGITSDSGETAEFAPGRLGQALTIGLESLRGVPYGSTITTMGPTTVVAVRNTDLDGLAIGEPALVARIRQNLSGR